MINKKGIKFKGFWRTIFILTIAAAEAAVGLAILVVYYRNRGSISVTDINIMKG